VDERIDSIIFLIQGDEKIFKNIRQGGISCNVGNTFFLCFSIFGAKITP
jgi:hypothetical protein